MYAVNCSVPKTLVRHIIRYYADVSTSGELTAVLEDVFGYAGIARAASGEGRRDLAKDRRDRRAVRACTTFSCTTWFRCGFSPAKIYRLAQYALGDVLSERRNPAVAQEFLQALFCPAVKRSCLPDGPKVGSVALSPRGDWRMPSDASAALWLAELEDCDKNRMPFHEEGSVIRKIRHKAEPAGKNAAVPKQNEVQNKKRPVPKTFLGTGRFLHARPIPGVAKEPNGPHLLTITPRGRSESAAWNILTVAPFNSIGGEDTIGEINSLSLKSTVASIVLKKLSLRIWNPGPQIFSVSIRPSTIP